MFAFTDEENDKRSAADRASDGILGDLLSKAISADQARRLAEVDAATTPEATERSWQKLKARMAAEGMLDENGHPKPASEMPAAKKGPERFISPAKGGRGVGGGDKKE